MWCSLRAGEGQGAGGWFRVGRARGGEGGAEEVGEGDFGGCLDFRGDGRGEGVASGFSGGWFFG